MKRWVMVVPLAVFLLVAVFLYKGLFLKPDELPSAMIGKPFPAFSLGTVQGDRTLTQAEIPIGIITALVGAPLFTWLLAQVPLVDLPLAQIAKNAGLMFFGFFPRTAAAALVLALYWGATLLYLPATILTILAFGFWLPVTIALMIVYPGLEKVFKLEETINARRAAEIEERMAQNQPKFDQ
jgi:hypothetical protein